MNEQKSERWIVTYRRYSLDPWKEVVFKSETAARQYAEDKKNDHHVEAMVRKLVEA